MPVRRLDWVDAALVPRILHLTDSLGPRAPGCLACGDRHSLCHLSTATGSRRERRSCGRLEGDCGAARGRTGRGRADAKARSLTLFATDGSDLRAVLDAADRLRAAVAGDSVTYVVNRNINYTNICTYHCGFCAFSKGRSSRSLRGPAYDLDLDEIAHRTVEAARGRRHGGLPAGRHSPEIYRRHLSRHRRCGEGGGAQHACPCVLAAGDPSRRPDARPDARGLPELVSSEAGLATLPGTAAEILDDEVRAILCPDKLNTEEWLEVMRTAHALGSGRPPPSCSDMSISRCTGPGTCCGSAGCRPRPGVSPSSCRCRSCTWRRRSGARAAHARVRPCARPCSCTRWRDSHCIRSISNIQTSWVKMGPEGAALCLEAGANDLGGTLMNESITRAAGGVHGQVLDARRHGGSRAPHRPPGGAAYDSLWAPAAGASELPCRRI